MVCQYTLSLSSNGHFPQIIQKLASVSGIFSGYSRRLCFLISNPRVVAHTLLLMSALKRTISPHNPSVTLFHLSSDLQHSPRRSKRIKTHQSPPSDTDLTDTPNNSQKPTPSGSALPRDVHASPKKFKAIPQSLPIPHPPPTSWRETYDTIKDMRARFVAPVDTMGCDRAQYKETEPKVMIEVFFILFTSRFSIIS